MSIVREIGVRKRNAPSLTVKVRPTAFNKGDQAVRASVGPLGISLEQRNSAFT